MSTIVSQQFQNRYSINDIESLLVVFSKEPESLKDFFKSYLLTNDITSGSRVEKIKRRWLCVDSSFVLVNGTLVDNTLININSWADPRCVCFDFLHFIEWYKLITSYVEAPIFKETLPTKARKFFSRIGSMSGYYLHVDQEKLLVFPRDLGRIFGGERPITHEIDSTLDEIFYNFKATTGKSLNIDLGDTFKEATFLNRQIVDSDTVNIFLKQTQDFSTPNRYKLGRFGPGVSSDPPITVFGIPFAKFTGIRGQYNGYLAESSLLSDARFIFDDACDYTMAKLINENTIVLHYWGFPVDFYTDYLNYLKIFEKILYSCMEKAPILNYFHITEEERHRKLAEFFTAYPLSKLNELINVVRSNTETLYSYEIQVQEVKEKIKIADGNIKYFQEIIRKSDNNVLTQLKRIEAFENVDFLSVTMSENQVEVHTKFLYLESQDGIMGFNNAPIEKYPLGRLIIKIPPTLTGITIHNKTANNIGYALPHVNNIYPCWGNVSDAIYQLGDAGDLETLIILILQYCKSYSAQGGPYKEHWVWWPLFHEKTNNEFLMEGVSYGDE